jgi:carboxylesterase type B
MVVLNVFSGSSVEHQVTAFGGKRGYPFRRAIAQAPAFVPEGPKQAVLQEKTARDYLRLAGVHNITEARQLNSSTIIDANSMQIANAPYGLFVYGPVVDGTFAPKLPGQLLASGQFARNISIMTGHNLSEAPVFTPPNVTTEQDFRDYIDSVYPGLNQSIMDTVLNNLYPADYSGSQPYQSPIERLFLMIGESMFTCNCYFLNRAYNKIETYAYEYQVPPAWHGLDIPYTYYDGTGTNITAGLIAPIAEIFQSYITNFALTGNPIRLAYRLFPLWE